MLMMEKCRLCHYQPLLLLYANPQGTPINADSGPKRESASMALLMKNPLKVTNWVNDLIPKET